MRVCFQPSLAVTKEDMEAFWVGRREVIRKAISEQDDEWCRRMGDSDPRIRSQSMNRLQASWKQNPFRSNDERNNAPYLLALKLDADVPVGTALGLLGNAPPATEQAPHQRSLSTTAVLAKNLNCTQRGYKTTKACLVDATDDELVYAQGVECITPNQCSADRLAHGALFA